MNPPPRIDEGTDTVARSRSPQRPLDDALKQMGLEFSRLQWMRDPRAVAWLEKLPRQAASGDAFRIDGETLAAELLCAWRSQKGVETVAPDGAASPRVDLTPLLGLRSLRVRAAASGVDRRRASKTRRIAAGVAQIRVRMAENNAGPTVQRWAGIHPVAA